MNFYQIRCVFNHDDVLGHIVAASYDRAKELYQRKLFWDLHDYEIILLSENITDKHGNSIKERIKLFN